jgi:type IV fimbrial biogenesis protein FimT
MLGLTAGAARMPALRARSRGFTIPETLVSISILATLAALAGPSVERLTSTYRVRETAYEVSAGVMLARSEAIKRGRDVVVTSAPGGWDAGWSIRPASAPDSVIRALEPAARTGVSATVTQFIFTKEGRVVGTDGAPVTVKLSVAPNPPVDDVQARCLVLAPSGVPTSREGPCT